jgi:hypothetical protein
MNAVSTLCEIMMSMIKIEGNVWYLQLVTRSVQFSTERDET